MRKLLSTLKDAEILKRIQLLRYEHIAAKHLNRWPELAQNFNLDKFRSLRDRSLEDIEIVHFRYNGLPVGTITTETINGRKARTTELSDFMMSMRNVHAAYIRLMNIGDQLQKHGSTSISRHVVLNDGEYEMLIRHEQFLRAELIFNHVGLKLSNLSKTGVYTITHNELVDA